MTMNKQTETALKMAIEALEKYVGVVQHKLNAETWGDIEDGGKPARNAIQACKEALEQPAQEPVAWMHRHEGEITEFNDFQSCDKCEPLYTHPSPSWQSLSDDEIRYHAAFNFAIKLNEVNDADIDFARAIEQALKEKNHG